MNIIERFQNRPVPSSVDEDEGCFVVVQVSTSVIYHGVIYGYDDTTLVLCTREKTLVHIHVAHIVTIQEDK